MSLYQLTIEPGTPFFKRHAAGKFDMPDEALAADMYELTQEKCSSVGLPAYEVSNHARKAMPVGIIWQAGAAAIISVRRRVWRRTGWAEATEFSKPAAWLESLSVAATVCRKSVYCGGKTCMPKPYCWACV